MIRRAKATWRGTGREGKGQLSTDSGVLAETPYSFRTRFADEKNQPRRTHCGRPRRLLHDGAGVSAAARWLHPTELSTEAAVSLDPEGRLPYQSFGSDPARNSTGLGEALFVQMASDAEKNCPVSRFSTQRSRWTRSSCERSVGVSPDG
jgi:osmotically inducible protein OsmC